MTDRWFKGWLLFMAMVSVGMFLLLVWAVVRFTYWYTT